MKLLRLLSLFASLAVAAAGCGGSSGGADCARDPASCGCKSDANCSGARSRCDTRTGQCVPCLPTSDNCPSGQHCVSTGPSYTCVPDNSCTAPADCPLSGSQQSLCCLGLCYDPQTSNDHCGTCGNVCGDVPNGLGGCVKGSCGVVQCNAGFADCDLKGGNGCETDITVTIAHCGGCGMPCRAAPNTKVDCVAGQCQYTCTSDFADCDGNPGNGCESSISTNPNSCGACGRVCPKLPNAATVACVNGACVPSTCSGDFQDCNRQPGDGCEADVKNDPNNCFSCGKKCAAYPNAAAGCVGGNCTVGKCNPGFEDCDKNVLNGCEQDLLSDPKNCGACGKTCNIANGIASCQGGMCVLQACSQGYADCDGNVVNGCESVTSRDLKNCGACGNACPAVAHGLPACNSGVCGLQSCDYGWGDCNRNLGDGCETSTLTPTDCGVCGNACPAYQNANVGCPNAACIISSCKPGFADCDNKILTGCEVATTSDANNCGGCNVVCKPDKNQAAACVAGKCGVGACLAGFADCNMNLADGCEAPVSGDPNNCGACGNVCPQNTPYCAGGKCTSSIHNTVAWPAPPYPYNGNSCNLNANGVLIGNFQAINLGKLTWKACMIEASKRNAMVTSPSYGNWPLPGWWAVRAPNSNLAMTGQWANYISADINTQQNCNVMREPQAVALNQYNSKGLLANTTVYDGNTWHYQDFGVMFIDQCMLLAGQYGASVITPWTIGLPNGDNYWQGILHTCSVYSWSSGNGTGFAYDNTINRVSQKGCMLGWIDG